MKTTSMLAITLLVGMSSAQVSLKSDATEIAQIKNAKLETVTASGNLQQQIEAFASRQSGTAWIGYALPATGSHRTICCYDGGWDHNCCGTCRLQSERGNNFSGSRDDCDDAEMTSLTVL